MSPARQAVPGLPRRTRRPAYPGADAGVSGTAGENPRGHHAPAMCRTLACALLVAQGDLVGLGDVVGLDGPESCAQALAGLP